MFFKMSEKTKANLLYEKYDIRRCPVKSMNNKQWEMVEHEDNAHYYTIQIPFDRPKEIEKHHKNYAKKRRREI